MKLKLSFGEGGLKGFLARHAEKIAFGFVLALVAFFVYVSAVGGGFDTLKSPLGLQTATKAALDKIAGDKFEQVAEDRVKLVTNDIKWPEVLHDEQRLPQYYPKLVERIRTRVDETPYTPTKILDPEPFRKALRRADPKFLAAIKVEAVGAFVPVAMRLTKPDDVWSDTKDAVEKPREAPKTAPKPAAKKKKTGDMYSEMMGQGSTSSRGGKGSSSRGSSSAMPGMSGMDDMYGGGYPMGGPGSEMDSMPMMPGGGGGRKALSPFFRKQYYANATQPTGVSPRVGARSFAVVAVKALVPYEKQWEEYENALGGRQGYVPQQDFPRYVMIVVQRAEVPEDPNAPLEWQPVGNSRTAVYDAMYRYSSVAKELADEQYLLPTTSLPIPPILLYSYENMALHPDVPRRKLRPVAAPKREEGPAPKADADVTETLTTAPPPGAPGMPGAMPGASPDGMGYPGMSGMADGGMTGYPGMGGMMPSGSSSMGSMGGYPGMPSMPGGYGEGMPGMPGATGGVQAAKVKYKLVRFFDLTAEAAKPYKYRVQLILEDPNRPQDPKADPNKRILDPAVVQRLAKVEADDQAYEKEKGKPRRTFFVTTEWSEPSNVVKVESPERVVGGGARAAKVISLGPLGDVPQTEAAGKLVSVVWDGRRATEVPVERDVVLGSVLNFTANADVLQPLTFAIKTLDNHHFRTESFVVDLRGGEEIFRDKDRTHILHSPGEFLVVNRKGELVVRNEIDDAEEYRRLLFIEDRADGGTSGGGASTPTMDYMMPGSSTTSDYFGPGS